ncbi:MAG: DEAD/DEAH box helicase [Polyangiaceae bacterium]
MAAKRTAKKTKAAQPTDSADGLAPFSAPVRAWFESALGAPTPVQVEAFARISAGDSVLVSAPTGSGKTLAAFLVALERSMLGRDVEPARRPGEPPRGVRILYVSPLKALANDIERNLVRPIAGILETARELGVPVHEPRVAMRTGDTAAKDRARFAREGADILITTPESLYLLLTSSARDTLRDVQTLIVDEIHAVAGTKRGSHLFVTLERLEAIRSPARGRMQRVGLSATQRPLETIARALGGWAAPGEPRPVAVVDAGMRRTIDLRVEVPIDDMAFFAGDGEVKRAAPDAAEGKDDEPKSIWDVIHPRLVELIRAHRSTMIFVNSRRLGERLTEGINAVAGEELALAHHGSVALETRRTMEERLKSGDMPAIVATSSLELGIDMGAVDLVIQIEAPPSVASGLQRVGRASHHVGGSSKGVVFPKYRGDLLACAATVRAMLEGLVEKTRVITNPLDILAQQVVAMVSVEQQTVDGVFEVIRRAHPFAELPRASLESVLDMLTGLYPSDAFASLRPRLLWDRDTGVLRARAGTRSVAITNGGTIPDRGLYGVYLAGEDEARSKRLGELDEEMVFERRVGDVFLLGASSWRIEEIGSDRVLVSPAPGEPGVMPFWRGDRVGRPAELGARVGELARSLADLTESEAIEWLERDHRLDERAAKNLVAYVHAQRVATYEVPSDRTIVVEKFRDGLGDIRWCIESPFGTRVHAAWVSAVAVRLRDAGFEGIDMIWSDDGIVFRFPDVERLPDDALFFPAAAEVEALVTSGLDATALFAGRFRENAGRALLLPRARPGKRTPLWSQRRRATELLRVASAFDAFPIILETYRECLRDALDLPALVDLLRKIEDRRVRVVTVETERPSPFAESLLFAYAGNFIYDGDAPLAERRASALNLDHARLKELLGEAELRDLLDRDSIDAVEAELQRTTRGRASHADALHDVLLSIGDLSRAEIEARVDGDAGALVDELLASKRAARVTIAGEPRLIAAEDAGRITGALGVLVGDALPGALLAPVADPLGDVVSRFARTHAPFTLQRLAERFALDSDVVLPVVAKLERAGRLLRGAFTPEEVHEEWCDADVLVTIKRRVLRGVRQQIQPVDTATYAAYQIAHQGIARPGRGESGLRAAVAQLEGAVVLASALLGDLLPARVSRDDRSEDAYLPRDASYALDALVSRGAVVWRGIEPVGTNDARVALYSPDGFALLAPPPGEPRTPLEEAVLRALDQRGAMFFRDLARVVGGFAPEIEDALWSLVWSGRVTNDTLAPIRARIAAYGRGREAAEGRWSLLEPISTSLTDRRAAFAAKLLERYGVLTRDAVVAETPSGGYGATYPVLRAMEDAGKIRRGYFVKDVGAMQFAKIGADDRMRSIRREPDAPPGATYVLASTDPANVYGVSVKWPENLAGGRGRAKAERSQGTWVVLRDGRAIAFIGRGRKSLLLAGEDRADCAAAVEALRAHAPLPIFIERVDGVSASASPFADILSAAGFVPSGEGLLLRDAPAGRGRR